MRGGEGEEGGRGEEGRWGGGGGGGGEGRRGGGENTILKRLWESCKTVFVENIVSVKNIAIHC